MFFMLFILFKKLGTVLNHISKSSIKWEKEQKIFFSYPTNRHFLGAGPAIGQEALQGGVIQGSIGVLL